MVLHLKMLQEASAELGCLSHFATGFLCDLGQFTLAWLLRGFGDITIFGAWVHAALKCLHIADLVCLVLPMSTNYH